MTFRLCLVGNSHIGAYKRAWTRISSSFDGVSIDMFGAAGSNFGDVAVKGKKIVASGRKAAKSFMLTGGADSISLDDYDGFAVIAGGQQVFAFVRLLKVLCPPFMNVDLVDAEKVPAIAAFLDSFKRERARMVVSDALFADVMVDSYRYSRGAQIVAALAHCGVSRLCHVATPFPSSAILTSNSDHILSRLVGLGIGPDFGNRIWRAIEAAMPKPARLIHPPKELVVEGLLTDRSYSQGSKALVDRRGEHDEDDLFHMNDVYGEIMLRRVIEAVRG